MTYRGTFSRGFMKQKDMVKKNPATVLSCEIRFAGCLIEFCTLAFFQPVAHSGQSFIALWVSEKCLTKGPLLSFTQKL